MNNINTVTNYFIMFVLYVIGLFVYRIENKSIFFGVRLPSKHNKKENFTKLKKQYRKNFSLSYILSILIYILLNLKVSEVWSVVLGNLFIFIGVIILSVNYYIMHKKVKLLKKNENWKVENEKEIMDDENYIMGNLYYNKNDSALWVNKREDGRITLNYAKPVAKGFLVIIVVAFIFAFARTLSFPEIFQDRKVEISENLITIEGKWGTSINKKEINKIALEKNLPMVLRRINGTTINKMKMGKFKVANYKEVYFYIMDRTNPFVAIYTKDNNLIVINYEDIRRTEDLYKLLKQGEMMSK